MILGALALLVMLTPLRAAPKISVQEVCEGLTCQCGCGLTVANCNHPTCGFAVPLREEVSKLIAKGYDRSSILSFYRHQYGEKVLSSPVPEGFNILAWVVPIVGVIIGAGLIVVALRRWRSRAEAAGSVTSREPDAGPRADPSLHAELERELRHLR